MSSWNQTINNPEKLKPVVHKKYVDDIFVLFNGPEHVKLYVDYMNSKRKNISFSFETEKDGQMPFLDVTVFRENGKFLMFTEKKHLLEFTRTFLVYN